MVGAFYWGANFHVWKPCRSHSYDLIGMFHSSAFDAFGDSVVVLVVMRVVLAVEKKGV